jgi:sec-independent protein translocase protein TatB
MFDIGWSEIVVIGVVALIVIGPKELPGVLRAVGHWTTRIRRMASEFQSQFQEAMREAEMADLKKEVDNLNDTAKGFASQFDPLNVKEATKWEPKTAEAIKPVDAPPEAAAVTPDGYAHETAAAPAAVDHGAGDEDMKAPQVASAASEAAHPAPPPATQPAPPPVPEGSGPGGAHS